MHCRHSAIICSFTTSDSISNQISLFEFTSNFWKLSDCLAHRMRNLGLTKLCMYQHFGFRGVSVPGGRVKVLEKDGNGTGLHVWGVTLNKPRVFYLIWLKNIFILLGFNLSFHHTNSSVYLCCLNQISEIQLVGSVGTAVKFAASSGNATSKNPLVLGFVFFLIVSYCGIAGITVSTHLQLKFLMYSTNVFIIISITSAIEVILFLLNACRILYFSCIYLEMFFKIFL